MKRSLVFLACLLGLALLAMQNLHAQSSVNYAIAFDLIDNGGAPGPSSAANYDIRSFVGQSAVRTSSTGSAQSLSSGAGCAFCKSNFIVDDLPVILPMVMRLYQNYPNPFNPSTTIRYSLERESCVEVAVYNLLGEKVDVLVRETQSPGDYSVDYMASDLAGGVYVYRLATEHGQLTRRFVLLK
jgi:hypothetical protein